MSDDLGKLILRLTLGGLVLLHGVNKIFNGVGFMDGALAAHGLPSFIAYGAYIGEVLAPLLVLLGIYSRIGGAIIAINMVVAIYLMHMGQFFTMTKAGGWALELQAFYLLTGVVVMLLGAGRFSVAGRAGKFN